jgi:hypothetical protein
VMGELDRCIYYIHSALSATTKKSLLISRSVNQSKFSFKQVLTTEVVRHEERDFSSLIIVTDADFMISTRKLRNTKSTMILERADSGHAAEGTSQARKRRESTCWMITIAKKGVKSSVATRSLSRP